MLETSTRLLELLSLLQTRRQWSGTELAQRLAVGSRTIRRDVERLRRMGYPVHAIPGAAGGYRLAAGASVPPLLLDDEEAVAIAVGLRTAVSDGVAGIEETSVRALSKLEQLLPERARRRVHALGAATVPYPASGPVADPETLLAIATACRDNELLRFGYRSREDERSRRLVEPAGLVHTGRRWYLVAWDTDRTEWRTFRVDRIESRPSPGRRFTPRTPPAADLAAYVAQRVSSVRDRHQVRVVLHAPAAEIVARPYYHPGSLDPIDDDTCLLRVGGEWLDGIALYITGLGVDFEVIEPPELVERFAVLAERFARAARSSVGRTGATADRGA
jgi:predicted DNA-binding transcriptional regulator YafY